MQLLFACPELDTAFCHQDGRSRILRYLDGVMQKAYKTRMPNPRKIYLLFFIYYLSEL